MKKQEHMAKKDRYALITGASSGIGAEFARQLRKAGYRLILTARREERLWTLAQELGEDMVCIIPADLSKDGECERLMAEIEDLPLHVVINNAGLGTCGRFVDGEMAVDENIIRVNVLAMHRICRLAVERFQRQGYGYLLNVGSSAGLLPAGPNMAVYYASKAYVVSLTRSIARELKEAKSRVHISVLCPGPVDTEFNQVAHVKFALPGITPEECVSYCLSRMRHGKVVIVPKTSLQMAALAGRLLPQNTVIAITSHQQKKKLEGDK